MKIDVAFDYREHRVLLDRLHHYRDAGRDLAPVMRSASKRLLFRAHESFEHEESPAGVPWAQLSPAYERCRHRSPHTQG